MERIQVVFILETEKVFCFCTTHAADWLEAQIVTGLRIWFEVSNTQNPYPHTSFNFLSRINFANLNGSNLDFGAQTEVWSTNLIWYPKWTWKLFTSILQVFWLSQISLFRRTRIKFGVLIGVESKICLNFWVRRPKNQYSVTSFDFPSWINFVHMKGSDSKLWARIGLDQKCNSIFEIRDSENLYSDNLFNFLI